MTAVHRFTRLGAALIAAAATAWASPARAQFTPLNPLLPAGQQRFVLDLPIPIDYVPDRTTFPGFDYYEVQMSPVTPVPVAFPQAGCPAGHAVARPPGRPRSRRPSSGRRSARRSGATRRPTPRRPTR